MSKLPVLNLLPGIPCRLFLHHLNKNANAIPIIIITTTHSQQQQQQDLHFRYMLVLHFITNHDQQPVFHPIYKFQCFSVVVKVSGGEMRSPFPLTLGPILPRSMYHDEGSNGNQVNGERRRRGFQSLCEDRGIRHVYIRSTETASSSELRIICARGESCPCVLRRR